MSEMLIRVAGGPWRAPQGRGYTSEAALQELLAEHPSLIPGVGADAVVCREFQSGVGPADLVAVDADGAVTLVECTLAANPQVRREVIGQVLDYASRLWRMPVERFDAQWITRTGTSLFTTLGDEDGALRAALAANLDASRLRIVLAVDEINDGLRRIVEYLNAITGPATAVIAVEYLRVSDDEVEILTPRTYGEELADAKRDASSGARHQWSVPEYREWVSGHDPTVLPTVDALLAGLEGAGFHIEGGQATTPSLNVAADVEAVGRKWPLGLQTSEAIGAVLVLRLADFTALQDIADRLTLAATSVPGIDVNAHEMREAAYRRRPTVPLGRLTPEDAAVFAALIGEALTSNHGRTPDPDTAGPESP